MKAPWTAASCGCARSTPAKGWSVPSNGSLTAGPGGAHVMIMGLKHPLKAGDHFDMTLLFAKAGPRKVTVTVKPSRAMMRTIRIVLWTLVAAVLIGLGSLLFAPAVVPASIDLHPSQLRRAVHARRQQGPAVRQQQARRPALCDVLRLHPLPGRLPDHLGAVGQAAPAIGRRRRGVPDRLRHRRSRSRRARRSRALRGAIRCRRSSA